MKFKFKKEWLETVQEGFDDNEMKEFCYGIILNAFGEEYISDNKLVNLSIKWVLREIEEDKIKNASYITINPEELKDGTFLGDFITT